MMAGTKKSAGAKSKYDAFIKKFSNADGYVSDLLINNLNQQLFDVEFDKEIDYKQAISYARKQGWQIYVNSPKKKSFFAVWFR